MQKTFVAIGTLQVKQYFIETGKRKYLKFRDIYHSPFFNRTNVLVCKM